MADNEVAGMVVKLAMEDGSFQESISNLNRQMKIVDSEFKAATGGAKNFGDSIDGLQANVNRLNDVVKVQSQLVGMYEQRLNKSKDTLERNVQAQEKLSDEIKNAKKQYEQASNTLGKNSEEAQKLGKELEKLQRQYDNGQQKIRNNIKQIDNHTIALNNNRAKLKQMESQLEEAEKAMRDFGDATEESSKAGVSGIDIMNVALGNLVAQGVEMALEAIKELAEYTLEFAMEMKKMSAMTGFSTESLQQWDAILKQTGGDIDTLTGSLMDFNERIYDATTGVGDGYEVFKELGIAVQNVDGSLRSTEDVFNDTVLALQNMEDESLKMAYATMLLSTGGEELGSVLQMTNEELEAMKGNVNIVSDVDLNAINDFNAVLKDLCDGALKEMMGILGDVAALLTPIIALLDMILTPILKIAHVVTDLIAEPFRAGMKLAKGSVEEGNKAIENNYKESYENLEGMAQEHNKIMEELSKVSMDSMSKELSDYESKLKKTYDESTRSGREAIRKRLENKEKELEEMYRKEEEYYKRLEQLRKDKYSSMATSSKIQGYQSGTKYHAGGLAVVGERGPEIVSLPRGAGVATNGHTQQIMDNQAGTGNTYNLNNVTIQTNNAKDLFEQIQILTRRGVII